MSVERGERPERGCGAVSLGPFMIHGRRKPKHMFKDSRPQKSAVTLVLLKVSLLLLSLKT